MQLNRFTVVLTAYRSDRSQHGNEKSQAELTKFVSDLNCFTFDAGQFRYQGVSGPVLAVQCKDFQDVSILVEQARKFEQDSVMLVDARMKAFLMYTKDCHMESLGMLMAQQNPNLTIPLPVTHTILNGTLYYTL